MLEVLAVVTTGLLINELHQCSPWFAKQLVRLYVKSLPEPHRARMLEEWLGMLENTPGNLMKFARALDLIRGINRVKKDLAAMHPPKPDEEHVPIPAPTSSCAGQKEWDARNAAALYEKGREC